MNKLVIFAIFILCSMFLAPRSNAQGNLQFNQVVTLSQNFNLTGCGSNQCAWTGPVFTVPAQKVWKIEYFSSSGVGDVVMTMNSTVNISGISTPIWLKAGDQFQMKKLCGVGASCGLQVGSFFISIIEFNVVP